MSEPARGCIPRLENEDSHPRKGSGESDTEGADHRHTEGNPMECDGSEQHDQGGRRWQEPAGDRDGAESLPRQERAFRLNMVMIVGTAVTAVVPFTVM
jgi:hypothetical protein